MNSINPLHLESIVKLVDKDNNLLKMINHVEANRLLKLGHCEILVEKPVAIMYIRPKRPEFGKQKPHAKLSKQKPWMQSRKSVLGLYGNYRILHPDGYGMFCCDHKKVLWYLIRDLVDIVDKNTFKLKFVPNGPGHVGDEFYLSEKKNQCVCCGNENNLSRHHVLPRCFRRFLPDELKCHNYHDILLLCGECHSKYETQATIFKRQLCKEYNVSMENHDLHRRFNLLLNETQKANFLQQKNVLSAANALQRYPNIPEPRKSELMNLIGEFLERAPTQEDIEFLYNQRLFITDIFDRRRDLNDSDSKILFVDKNVWKNKTRKLQPDLYFGKFIIDKILSEDKYQDFVETWRDHFITSMNPQFLPEHWNPKRKELND